MTEGRSESERCPAPHPNGQPVMSSPAGSAPLAPHSACASANLLAPVAVAAKEAALLEALRKGEERERQQAAAVASLRARIQRTEEERRAELRLCGPLDTARALALASSTLAPPTPRQALSSSQQQRIPHTHVRLPQCARAGGAAGGGSSATLPAASAPLQPGKEYSGAKPRQRAEANAAPTASATATQTTMMAAMAAAAAAMAVTVDGWKVAQCPAAPKMQQQQQQQQMTTTPPPPSRSEEALSRAQAHMAHELLSGIFRPEEGKAQWKAPGLQLRLVEQLNKCFVAVAMPPSYTRKKLGG